MNPLLLAKLVGIGAVLLAASFAGVKVNHWRHDSQELASIRPLFDKLVDAQAKANKEVEEKAPVDEQARVELAAARVELDRARSETSRAWGRVRALEERTDEAGNRVVRLSDGFGVCFAAAAAGVAADVAACEAAGSDGPVEAGPGNGGL